VAYLLVGPPSSFVSPSYFQYVPKEYVNLLLGMFFIVLGVSALTRACR